MDWREVIERDQGLGLFDDPLPSFFSDPSPQPGRLKDGYPIERFVVPPTPEFICVICLCVVRRPMECLNCGVLICEKCVETYKEVRRQQRRATHYSPFACPACRESAYPVFPSKVLVSILEEADIYCKYRGRGCPAATPLGHIRTHERNCGYKVTKCAFCGLSGAKEAFRKWERHWTCSEACERTLKFKQALADKRPEDAIRLYHALLQEVAEAKLPSSS